MNNTLDMAERVDNIMLDSIEQYERVCAYIDLNAIRHNVENIRANICENTKILAVIKADGYGHGAVPIAREIEDLDYVYGFAVACVEEAVQLRKAKIYKPILVLGYTFPSSYEALIEHEIMPAVFRTDMLCQLDELAGRLNKKLSVHIKVDTGMSRIGVCPDMTGEAFVKKALGCKNLVVDGIFTHFSKADEKDKTFANKQLNDFTSFVEKCEMDNNYKFPLIHCSNSAGIIDMPNANKDLVRAGICLYGLWPSDEVNKERIRFKPVLSLKSHIVYIKEVEKGTPVSYNGTYTSGRKTKIATIPVGYADGYPRGLSNKGHVLIRGMHAPIIGRICMDQFMVDVTDIPGCMEGDEVVLVGTSENACITVEELGSISGRFNYEFVCDIGKRVPRVFCKNGKACWIKDYSEDTLIKYIQNS